MIYNIMIRLAIKYTLFTGWMNEFNLLNGIYILYKFNVK